MRRFSEDDVWDAFFAGVFAGMLLGVLVFAWVLTIT